MTPAELEAIRARVERSNDNEEFGRDEMQALLTHIAELREAVKMLTAEMVCVCKLYALVGKPTPCETCRARRVLGEGE